MAGKTIFLSYRREDCPGYVSKLESELEQAFGSGRVFRDVQDIEGGSDWKDVIEQNLRGAAALILVIGPRWQGIWQARKGEPTNHVAIELDQARRQGIRILPVTINGAQLPSAAELGESAWLLASQAYDISDRQGRWASDVEGLIRILEGVNGIGAAKPRGSVGAPARKRFATASRVAAAALVLALLAWLLAEEPALDGPAEQPGALVGQASPRMPTDAGGQAQAAVFPETFPDIAGTWEGRDGTLYHVSQMTDGTFSIVSPGYSNGSARFIDGMPNKFEVHMQGVGRGEFAVSTGGERIVGWILVDGKQEYDTLKRLQ